MGKGHRTVDRIARILETVAGHPEGLTFSEISDAIDAPRSSIHALMQGLIHAGYLEQQEHDRKVLLGSGLELLLAPFRASDVQRVAHPKMVQLEEKTGETVVLSVRQGTKIVHIDQVESRQMIKYATSVPRRRPLEAASSGKVFLANLPEKAWQRYIQARFEGDPTFEQVFERLSAERAEIRRKGVAYNLGETVSGVWAVGAPIVDDSGSVIAGLSVAGPEDRMRSKLESVSTALRDVADEISALAGASRI